MVRFWRTGYETTSVAELSEAMGITVPSLYTAFGDKRRLFLEALERYAGLGPTAAELVNNAPTARDAARVILMGSVDLFTRDDMPRGCLMATSVATGSDAAEDVRAVPRGMRRELQTMLAAKARADVAGGRLRADADADALAGATVAMVQGLSTLARDGASREALHAVAHAVLAIWG